MSGTTTPQDAVIERLKRERDKAEAEVNKLAVELNKLRADQDAGVLAQPVQQKFIHIFSRVPGLGMVNFRNLPTTDEVLAVIVAMSAQLQGLYDKNFKLEEQTQHTNNMLASAGALFASMQQAHQKRLDAVAEQRQRIQDQISGGDR